MESVAGTGSGTVCSCPPAARGERHQRDQQEPVERSLGAAGEERGARYVEHVDLFVKEKEAFLTAGTVNPACSHSRAFSFCLLCSLSLQLRRPASWHALQQSITMLRLLAVLLLPAAIIVSMIPGSVGFLVTCSPAHRPCPGGARSMYSSRGTRLHTAVRQMLLHYYCGALVFFAAFVYV